MIKVEINKEKDINMEVEGTNLEAMGEMILIVREFVRQSKMPKEVRMVFLMTIIQAVNDIDETED